MAMKKSLSKTKRKTDAPKQMDPRVYLKEPYARVLIPESDGTFSAELLEFPGCFAEGDTAAEAFENLESAAESWIAVALDEGQDIPPPSANYGYSGKIVVRLPKSLHRLAARKAERDGVSLNQCLVTAIATWVGADNFYDRYAKTMRAVPMQIVANTSVTITHTGSAIELPQISSWTMRTASAGTGVQGVREGLSSLPVLAMEA